MATVVFIVVAIGFVASLTADMSSARMGLPLLGLGAVVAFTVAADVFMLALLAKRLVEDDLRRLWVGGFLVWELGTAVFLMAAALVVLNR